MPNTVKVGDKIYYRIIHRGDADQNKMKVYDINKKEEQEFVSDEVLEFTLSPNKNQILIVTYDHDKGVNQLILTDLEGKKREHCFLFFHKYLY